MKKGFTLVELLAVIIILGVILVIAIPSFNNAIKESKIKLYKSINQMVVKSTKEYLTEYVYELPKEEGETIEVTTNDLISNGYLKEISNPTDKNDTCTGYVLITKLENNEYSYIPHINCEEDINNSTEDGLVLHYTFDDFQEPTTNLVPNSSLFSSGWSSYSNGNDGSFATEFGTEGLNVVNRISWNGAHRAITLPSSGTYTLSVWIKVINRTSSSIKSCLYTSGGGISDTADCASWDSETIGKWQKIEMTRTYSTNSIRLYLISYGGQQQDGYRVTVQYTMPQIELKTYSTPFVNGSRTGIVKDYSGNNNISNLSLDTTPRWMPNTDGISGYYDLMSGKWMAVANSQSLNLNSFTINVWVKYRDYTYPKTFGAIKKSSPSCYLSTGKGFDFGHGYQSLGLDVCLGDGVHVVRNTLQFNSGNRPPDLLNKWTHLSLVVDRSSGYIYSYINGELQSHKVNISSVTGDINTTASLTIGTLYGWTTDASLDDFRIYSRVLSSNEIEMMYNISKDNYK